MARIDWEETGEHWVPVGADIRWYDSACKMHHDLVKIKQEYWLYANDDQTGKNDRIGPYTNFDTAAFAAEMLTLAESGGYDA